MATTLTAAVAQAACNHIVDQLDAGGTIEWQDAGSTLLATTTLPTPAFGAATSASASVATLQGVPLDSGAAGATGTIAKAVWKDSGTTEKWTDSVGTSGATINLNSVSLITGGYVRITAYTFTLQGA